MSLKYTYTAPVSTLLQSMFQGLLRPQLYILSNLKNPQGTNLLDVGFCVMSLCLSSESLSFFMHLFYRPYDDAID